MKEKITKELTEKQKRFCYWYVEGTHTMLEIAHKLVVHRNTLSNWLKEQEVKNFINEIRQKDAVMTLQDKR
jgi:phage terminase small subunit